MTSNIIEELKKQFSDDLLYKYLVQEGFEEVDLFPAFLNEISIDRVYSTIEVAAMFNTNDNNLRYQMKIVRTLGYIDSFKAGRNYRFNYINIFRMYLVVSILNLKGRNTGDIANILYKKSPPSHAVETTGDKEDIQNYEQVTIHSKQLNELAIQILNKQISVSELQSKLLSNGRNYLQLDQKFNFMLLQSEMLEKLNESVKQSTKKWFSKQVETDVPIINASSSDRMSTIKEQLDALQTEIYECEKQLLLELFEIKTLFEKQLKLLK